VAGIQRTYKHNYAILDINGFWPSAPGQPFGGWGRVDPTRGRVDRQTNNRWSTLNYRALEITVAKNFSKGFQFVGGFNRQWQHYGGTWNPTDPARFLQPDAFQSNKLLYQPRGNNEDTSLLLDLGDNTLSYGPTWQRYNIRFGATWQAPKGFLIASSFMMWAGPYSGPVTDLLPADHPDVTRFGPAVMPNGQSNPLSTRQRFVKVDCAPAASCLGTREDQVEAPAVKVLGLKVAKTFRLGHGREFEVAGNVFDLFNEGNYTQFNYNGTGEKFNPNFLQLRNQQPARGFQLTGVVRF
jgi:hypothetical protein